MKFPSIAYRSAEPFGSTIDSATFTSPFVPTVTPAEGFVAAASPEARRRPRTTAAGATRRPPGHSTFGDHAAARRSFS